jgi:glycosyltransferase involved in cell wall biosynthesis
MNILYITPLLPKVLLEQVYVKDKSHYVFAPQKFHRNLVEGFIANGHQIQVLSVLPSSVDYVSRFDEDGIQYGFIPFTCKPGIKHIQIAIGVYRAIRKNKSFKPDVVICDTLNSSICIGAFLAKRKTKAKYVGIVTDLPESVSQFEKGLINRASSFISSKYIKAFDYYVLLTQQMNEVVNPKNRPYIIMEGVCDIQSRIETENEKTYYKIKDEKRRILYAGGRPSKDGVDMLISAFRQIPDKDLELNVYGSMPDVELGKDPDDMRIVYHGKTENSVIDAAERESYLLVNPRPTGEDYTKYSFPSKVMEYMASGTPMVTTRLAGIPEDYFKYVYTFDQCTTECYLSVLTDILSKDRASHLNKGKEAQQFVLDNKNKVVQTKRIISLLNKQ